ncbi:MAG: hypothetical protein FJX76_20175 [Armatimonadetes bacterium]|nr:hypothetical protein [Armatimonadota bacterium]
MNFRLAAIVCLMMFALGCAREAPPSGPQLGEAVMPFTSNVVCGPNRGMQHCFVCDTRPGDPGLVVFLRTPDSTARAFLDVFRQQTAGLIKDKKMVPWVVFLGEPGTKAELDLERQVEDFARASALTQMNITVLGDPAGPPGYRVSPEAAATFVVFKDNKAIYNKAFTASGWSKSAGEKTMADVTALLNKEPAPAAASAAPKGPEAATR